MDFKRLLAPVIATVALAIQLIFGVEIPEEVLDTLAVTLGNLVLVGITIYGLFQKNGKKDDK